MTTHRMPSRPWTAIALDNILPWHELQRRHWRIERTEGLFSNFPRLFTSAMIAELKDGKDLKSTLAPLTEIAVSVSQPSHPPPD